MIYPVDFSFKKVIDAYEKLKRNGFFRENFKNISFYSVPDEMYKGYIYGYNKSSERGREIWEKDKNRRERAAKLSKLITNI